MVQEGSCPATFDSVLESQGAGPASSDMSVLVRGNIQIFNSHIRVIRVISSMYTVECVVVPEYIDQWKSDSCQVQMTPVSDEDFP